MVGSGLWASLPGGETSLTYIRPLSKKKKNVAVSLGQVC
jgi:hypothetical protein